MKNSFFNLFENDFVAIFPELFLAISALILLMYGVTAGSKDSKPILIENVGWMSIFALGITFFLVVNNPCHNMIFFYNSLIVDDFTVFFKGFLLLSCIFTLSISFDYLRQEGLHAFEYILLILLSTVSMLLMISSYDFISMYLTIEMQSLCFYVLAASKRNSEFSTEAGLKYFILGAFSSGILLFGASLIYGFSGITNFEELTKLSHSGHLGTGVTIGMLFIAVGFLFKLTAAPFHMWAPDVYEGAPTAITAFFSIVPKIALFGLFCRLFFYTGPFGSLGSMYFAWEKILLFSAIASMMIGAFSALSQQKIKRLFAYSSVGHVGYMLIGLLCASREGIESFLVYLIIYILMTLNVFAILLSLRSKLPSISHESSSVQVRYLSDLAMLSKTHPVLAITFTLTLFSMAGIPPLAGFCGKFYIFFSALSSSLYLLAFVGIFTSVVSCFYYIRVIKIMYFEKLPENVISFQPIDQEKAFVLAITLFFLVFFIFYPSPIFLIAQKVALSLVIV
jgi:proton-translocating NADH-quinone oxidoreductase chain N